MRLTLAFLFISFFTFSQNVFKEDFNHNNKHWNLKNDYVNKSSISGGMLNWSRSGQKSDVLMQYLNRLDDTKDFSVTIKLKSTKIGSEYGLLWGGKNKSNANYFLIKGKKFRTFKARNGKIESSTDYKINLKISVLENILAIEKKGNQIQYKINEVVVMKEPYAGLEGKFFGAILWQNSAITVDYIYASGTALKINVIDKLEYPEKPIKLSSAINSKYNEMNPVISAGGNKLYFSRKAHPSNKGKVLDLEDAYFSEFKNGKWTPAQNIGSPINNTGPNAVHAVTPDGNTLVLMNTYEPDGSLRGPGLSISHKTASGWEVPKSFKIKHYFNLSTFNEFFLSNNEKVLLMAVEREGGEGDRDLYVSFNEGNDIWSKPMNMGNVINSPGTELSPFLASDGVTLYFSSVGHPGYGKNDVFMTRRLDDTWTNWSVPQNLGAPINGEGVDSYYSVPANGEYAYYISSDKALKTTDIYKVKLPEKVKPKPVVIVKGIVRDSKTNKPLGTKIVYYDFKTNKEMGIAHSDPVTGKYEIVLPLGKEYSLYADKQGYYAVQDRLDLTKAEEFEEVEKDLFLTPIEIGQSAQMKNVLFYRGTANLMSGSYPELNKLVNILKENETMKIEISGHTDNVGDPGLNLDLSKKRANAVKNYLMKKGITQTRVISKGYGGTKPIADNKYEYTKKLNRRVEFTILSD